MDINGTPDVSQPIWKEVEPMALKNKTRLMCRLRYAEIPELDIKPAKELKLLAQNSIFVISDENINTLMITPPAELELDVQQAMSETEEIVFASSNYVKQNQDRKSNMILSRQQNNQQAQQLPSQTTQRSTQRTSAQPTRGRTSAPISRY